MFLGGSDHREENIGSKVDPTPEPAKGAEEAFFRVTGKGSGQHPLGLARGRSQKRSYQVLKPLIWGLLLSREWLFNAAKKRSETDLEGPGAGWSAQRRYLVLKRLA
jgi:hypothetical protein